MTTYTKNPDVIATLTPEQFRADRESGLKRGFLEVVSGPLVRSSYRAERVLEKNNAGLDAADG